MILYYNQLGQVRMTYKNACFDGYTPNYIPVHEFIRRLEETKPKERPIVITTRWAGTPPPGGANVDYDVEFNKGSIKIGCTTIGNNLVRQIASKLID